MRVLGWVLAGALALTARSGSRPRRWVRARIQCPTVGTVTGVEHPSHQRNGGPVSPRWCSNCPPGGWVPYGGPGVPTYWVYVPGSAVYDYRFADWRGPTGGWGNP